MAIHLCIVFNSIVLVSNKMHPSYLTVFQMIYWDNWLRLWHQPESWAAGPVESETEQDPLQGGTDRGTVGSSGQKQQKYIFIDMKTENGAWTSDRMFKLFMDIFMEPFMCSLHFLCNIKLKSSPVMFAWVCCTCLKKEDRHILWVWFWPSAAGYLVRNGWLFGY